ncbi:MAG: hypothetical protein ACLSDF_02590 [Megasphaera micronuciformis]
MRQQEKLTTRQLLIPYIANFIGSVIAAIGINGFFIPQHLLSSGMAVLPSWFITLRVFPSARATLL